MTRVVLVDLGRVTEVAGDVGDDSAATNAVVYCNTILSAKRADTRNTSDDTATCEGETVEDQALR